MRLERRSLRRKGMSPCRHDHERPHHLLRHRPPGQGHVPPVDGQRHLLAADGGEHDLHSRLPERERQRSAVADAAPDENADFLPRFDKDAQDPHKLQHSGVAVADGTLSLAFGAVRVAVARDIPAAVHFLQLILAAGVADTLGLLLTLVWTAGFLPGFLAPQAVAVLLAKPVPRWALLAGKYIGVLAFVLAQAVYFVGGTWLALGLRTGVWDATYLLCIPLLLLQFAVFFGFSLLLAVCCRSTVVCVIRLDRLLGAFAGRSISAGTR